MDVFALSLQLKEEGAATVKAAVDKLNRSFKDGAANAKAYDMTIGSLKDEMQSFASGLALASVLSRVITETIDAERSAAQLNAALKSTAGVANQSVEALNRHAEALSYMSMFDDDAITGAQALLLTFTQIRDDVFPAATQAIVDMATAMNVDLRSATMQVGKALNDPILGVGALARAGVQFSAAQKEVIAQLVETGRTAEAQRIILQELETQFGGSAKAAANTFGGAIAQLNNELGNLLTLSNTNSSAAVKFVNLLSLSVTGLNTAINRLSEEVNLAFPQVKTFFEFLAKIAPPNIAMLLAAIGKGQRDAAVAAAAAQTPAEPFQSVIANAVTAVKVRQTEIAQLVKLAEVKQLNASQTALLRSEAANLTAELNRQGLSIEAQIGIGERLAVVQKALQQQVREIVMPRLPKMKPLETRIEPIAALGPKAVTGVAPAVVKQVREQMDATEREWAARTAELRQNVGADLAQGLTMTLADSIGSAFETAFATGNIGEGFKALGRAMLSGLGSMIQAFGVKALAASKLMATLLESFKTLNPYIAIPAALGLIALGGALKGAAAGAFGGAMGAGMGGTPFVSTIGGQAGGAGRLPGVFYGPTAAGGVGQIQPTPSMNVTIIGPNDPSAQRQMQELMRNAQRRGSV